MGNNNTNKSGYEIRLEILKEAINIQQTKYQCELEKRKLMEEKSALPGGYKMPSELLDDEKILNLAASLYSFVGNNPA